MNEPRTSRLQWPALATAAAFAGSLAFVFGESLLAHMQLAALPNVRNDDARQQIYPFFKYHDPGLFQHDYIGDYYLACLPWGYRALYTLAGYFDLAIAASKVVPYVGLLVTVVCLALCARRIGGVAAAWVAAALCLSCGMYLSRMGGGLPRAFAFPLLSLAAYALAAGRIRLLAALPPLGAAFYPASAVPIGLSLLLVLLLPSGSRGEAASWTLRRRAIVCAASALAAALVLLPPALLSRGFGRVITPGDVAEFPEAGPGGRYGRSDRAPFASYLETATPIYKAALTGSGEPLHGAAFAWANSPDRGSDLRGWLLAFCALGFAAACVKQPPARRFALLGAAAVAGHTLAVPIAPYFYLPQRYVFYPVPIVVTVVVATGACGFLGLHRALARVRWLVPVVVLCVGSPVLAGFGARGSPRAGLGRVHGGKLRDLAEVAALPKDALVAGWPRGPIDDVPYLARRRVLVGFETHQAFHAGYALEMRRRTHAVIAAYYATTLAPLVALRRDFGVTHLLVDPGHFRGRPPRYFRPFSAAIAAAFRAASGRSETLRQLAHQRGRVRRPTLLDLSRLTATLPAPP